MSNRLAAAVAYLAAANKLLDSVPDLRNNAPDCPKLPVERMKDK